jgi:hypothetical protein
MIHPKTWRFMTERMKGTVDHTSLLSRAVCKVVDLILEAAKATLS